MAIWTFPPKNSQGLGQSLLDVDCYQTTILAAIFIIAAFFVFDSFDDTICFSDRQDLVLVCTVDQQF
jgi:hypothetical protein